MSAVESPAPTRTMGTLGTLFLVGRKSQLDVQSFPIDAERVTIGRDYDCDIRLYFSDVSKLHCEIVFDLETGTASITVHGGNGIQYTPNGGETAQYKPPSVLQLGHGDTFMLRKKLFRFEYGLEETLDTTASVAGTPSKFAGSPAKPIRRRASHRMSLVPSTSDFVPHSPVKGRRQSLAARGPSKLSQTHMMEETPEEQAEEELVNVVHGDEGDRVFVELKDESHPSQQIQHLVFSNGPTTPQQAAQVDTTARKQTPAVTTPSRVNASVALTTPRGSSSLRKSLLLQSARKTWKETQSPGVEGAIESGNIQVRRKSISPRVNNRLKSPPPPEHGYPDEDMGGEQEELQWIEEDPSQQAAGADSESDANDSFEADVSLDIPGQSVLDLSPLRITDDQMELEEQEAVEEVEETEPVEEQDAMANDEEEEEEEEEEVEEEGKYSDNDSFVDVNNLALPGTPAASRQLQRFYTPQPRRSIGQPRRSIASIGGPAVRFKPAAPLPNFASTPIRFHARTGTPIGKPVRIGTPSTPVSQEAQSQQVDQKPSVGTPAREAMRAEAKRRRETLATPRALPAPPASGFKSIAREVPHLKFGTPSHPALAPDSPASEDALLAVPATPLNDIRRRLGDLRRQSMVASASRRSTVGFAQPSTPASRFSGPSSYSVAASARRRIEFSIPQTPPGEDDEFFDEDPAEHSPLPHPETPVQSLAATASENEKAASAPKTPSFAGLRQMLAPRPPPKTPNFTGLRNLFPEAQPVATPSFAGMKQMLAERPVPPTPNFVGVRQMYQVKEEPATPVLDGVADMYEAIDGEGLEQDDDEEEETRSRPSRRAAAKANDTFKLQSNIVKEESDKRKVPAKRSRATKAQAAHDDSQSVPSKLTRSRRAATVESSVEPETRATSSRSKRTPTAEPEAPSKATRRSRKAEATAEIEDKASKPSRSRSTRAPVTEDVLGELVEQSEVEDEAVSSKPARKRAATSQSFSSNIADEASASSKRGKKTASKGEKENEPEDDEEPSKTSAPAKKTATRKTGATKKAAGAQPAPVEEVLSASSRTTRSRN